MNFKNNNFVIIAVLVFLFIGLNTSAQVGVGTNTPNANAMLDVESTEKGFLPPRMSTVQKTTLGGLLASADEGMTVYDTDNNTYEVWDGAAWVVLGSGGGSSSSSIGNMYFDDTVTSNTSSISTTSIKISGTTQSVNLTDFTSSNNRLTYTGADTKVFSVNVSLSFLRTGGIPFTQGGVTFFLSKGASGLVENGISNNVGLHQSGDSEFIDNAKAVSLTGTVSLATGEYIEIWARTIAGSYDILVTNFNVVLD